MNIFNSLGSNYDLPFVIKSLILQEKGARKNLINFLEKKYQGSVVLAYKGRQALTIGLRQLNLPQGSKVAIAGFTCIAVVDAVKEAGLIPVFIDIESRNLNFTKEKLEQKIGLDKNIKVVIIQNTLGYPCDIEGILNICRKYKLKIVEDLAHSVGASYKNGKEAGTIGDITCLSFSQDKIIDAVSGGAVILKSTQLFAPNSSHSKPSFQDKWYPLFTWVIRKTYPLKLGKVIHGALKTLHLLSDPMKIRHKEIADWHAMLALEELRMLEKNIEHRKKIASVYAKNLPPEIIPSGISIDKSTNLRFPVFVKNRTKILETLKKNGVYLSDIWYDTPIAPKKYFTYSGYKAGECPTSEKIAGEILNLPTHKNVSEKDALNICQIIQSWEK